MTKAAADAGYSAELESDPPEPEPAPGTQLTDQPTPGDTPTGVKVTYTLRTSQVLADCVLNGTFEQFVYPIEFTKTDRELRQIRLNMATVCVVL